MGEIPGRKPNVDSAMLQVFIVSYFLEIKYMISLHFFSVLYCRHSKLRDELHTHQGPTFP